MNNASTLSCSRGCDDIEKPVGGLERGRVKEDGVIQRGLSESKHICKSDGQVCS